MAHWGTLIGFIYILSGVSQCQGSYPIFKNDTEKFRNLAVSDSYVYIGGESSIIQIDSKFLNQTKLISISDYPENWLLKVVNMTEEKILVCNYKSKFLYDTTCKIVFGGNETISREIKVKSGLRHVVSLFVQGKTIVFGSSSCLYTTGYEACYAITNLKLSNMAEYKRLSVEYSGGFNAQQLKFLSIFKADKFLYFLFKTEEVSKLGKMCFEDRTITHNLLNSYEDTPIECSHNDRKFKEVAGSVIWNSHLFVAFTHGEENIICKYSFQDIGEMYLKSRKERLNCSNAYHLNKIFKKDYIKDNDKILQYCFTGHQCIGIGNDKVANCPEVTSEDNGFCKTRLFGSVEGQLPINSDIVIYHSNSDVDGGKIVKLGIQDLKTHAILYIGTSQGTIGKIFVSNYTEKEKALGGFRAVQPTFPVLDIQVNRDDVYVMTENRVVNIAEKDPCPNTKYCNVCMESINPICGWDILAGSCQSISTGLARDGLLGFLPSLGRKCLRIDAVEHQVNDGQAIDPVPIVNFQFRFFPPVLPKDMVNNVSCSLNGTSQMSLIAYADTEEMFSCKLQNVTSGQEVVVLKDENIIAKTEIQLYQCSDITSCYGCLHEKECYWCKKTFNCVHNNHTCSDYSDTGINTPESCPAIDIKKLIIHEDETKLTLKTKNMENLENLSCIVEEKENSGRNSFPVEIGNTTHVMCDIAKLQVKKLNIVRIFYENMKSKKTMKRYVNGSAQLEVYDCNDYKSCGICKYRYSIGHKCQWLGSKCQWQNRSIYSERCDTMKVKKIDPDRGPLKGGTSVTIEGTNLGFEQNVTSVNIGNVTCTNVTIVDPSNKITCVTGAHPSSGDHGVIVKSTQNANESDGDVIFTYVNVTEEGFEKVTPKNGTRSGGRKINIFGEIFGFIGSDYKIEFCNSSEHCIGCQLSGKSIKKDHIRCSLGKTEPNTILTRLHVLIDGKTTLNLTDNVNINIVDDPELVDVPKIPKMFKSGGFKILLKGKRLRYVDSRKMGGKECELKPISEKNTKSKTDEMECTVPKFEESNFRRKRSTDSQPQFVNMEFDNFNYLLRLYYIEDPNIFPFKEVVEYKGDGTLTIKGERLLDGAKQENYEIDIGLTGRCFIEEITKSNITCSPPSSKPRTNHSDDTVALVVLRVGGFVKKIGYLKYVEQLNILAIVAGTLAALLLITVVCGAVYAFKTKRKRELARQEFEMKLSSIEENIRATSREEFADAQMTIKDIKSDLVTSRVPYLDYQSYVFHHLFPNQEMETDPLLHEPMITDDNRKRVQEAMDVFSKLLTNKLFLKFLVKTFDSHVKGLTMQDKAQFASLLSVALIGNMRLFYQLISCLLEDMIKDANKKQQKLLFRRFESITQRLTVNWLVMSLYQHLQNHSGMQLFMLYKATQTVIERGPIDAVNTSCKYTLAEERLLKTRVDCETLRLNIDLNGNSDHKIPVDVLDCDTITQVKHKCCSAIYKNKPASEIPSPDDLELEWHAGKGGRLTLKDVDNISDRNNGMLRLNTLKHYLVRDGSEMALMYIDTVDDQEELYVNQIISMRQQMENLTGSPTSSTNPDSVKLLMQSETTENLDGLKWHLSNLTDEEKSNNEHEIGEIFLNRIFHTKLILKDYIDAAFEGIMDPQSLSVPVRYFLCMLDKQGKNVGVDSDVLLSWKSECYATRVWASLIAKPQLLFDVHVPSHVEPCMDILKQVFIDSFTQNPQHVTKDASTQKLLFCKDIPIYRKQVNSFFHRVESVPDQQFWSVLDDISNMQTQGLKFSRQAILHQLYKFISKYKDQIFDAFEDEEESKNLDFANKFEKVAELMEDS